MDSHHTLRIPCIILAAVAAFSCQEKEPTPLTIDSEPEVIAAEGGSTTFTFTAPGQWTAGIQPASDGTEVSWLTIDPASGEAGQHTVTLTAEANTDKETRTAVISVASGSSSATISVSQVGDASQDEPEEPDTPDHTGLVKSVEVSFNEDGYHYNFEYDGLNRVSQLQVRTKEGGEYVEEYTNNFTYNEDGTVILDSDLYEEGPETINIVLDQEGKATEMISTETSPYDISLAMSYNDDGQLTAVKDNIWQESEMECNFEWSNGDNVKMVRFNNTEEYSIPFSDYESSTNIDINWLSSIKAIIYIHQPPQFLGAAGMLGKRDAHYALPYSVAESYGSPDEITLPDKFYYSGDLEPDSDGYVTYTHTVEYYLPDECITTFDTDNGVLRSIRYEMPLHEMAITCKCRIETEEGLQFLIPEDVLERKDTVTGNSAISSVTVTYY